MISTHLNRASLSLSALLLGFAGCKKSGDRAGTALTVEQVPVQIETAFRNAPEETRKQAADAAAAVQSQNDASAFAQLDGLSRRPDLTPEQRQAAFESWMAVNVRLQQSAAGGNTAAQDLLDKYRATK